MEMNILYRSATFIILAIMAYTDFKTKTVPILFPLLPSLFSIFNIDYLLKQGYLLDFYWYLAIGFVAITCLLLYLTKAWAPADCITVGLTTPVLFTYEIVGFFMTTMLIYIAITLGVKYKKISLDKTIPMMPIIAVAYILAVALI